MSFVEAISEVSENIFWLLAMPKVRGHVDILELMLTPQCSSSTSFQSPSTHLAQYSILR